MKRFLTFFIVLIYSSTIYAAEPLASSQLYAKAAVLMDADTGRVLFSKNGNAIMAMASTTKIMTCILALENGNLSDTLTVSSLAASQPKVHLGMRGGEQYVLRDLLYSLMLESHNDSAVAIAEHIGGSVEEFVNNMNQKAMELGCLSTHFITPNGLDAVDEEGIHSTTAEDLARIMSYCIMESPMREEYLRITATPSYSFKNVEGNRAFSCQNLNSFLTMMDGAISGKTGFTGNAGYCYVGAVERDGRTFVVALLACGWPNNKNYKWKDTKKIMEYAIEHYQYFDDSEHFELPRVLVDKGVPASGDLFDEQYVQLRLENTSEDDLQMLRREDEAVSVKTEFADRLEAPLKKGQKVGRIVYCLDGEEIFEYAIVVDRDVERKDMRWYFERILKMFFCT